MKHMNKIVLVSMFGFVTISGLQAGAFTNLDFESANTNNITDYFGIQIGATKDLAPGWTLKDKNGVEMTNLFLNSATPGGLPLAILESKVSDYTFPYDGQYGLSLVSSTTDPLFLSQTGTIPLGTKYINFSSLQNVSLTINGTPVGIDEVPVWKIDPHFPILSKNLAWADVSAYAGQEVTLTFASDVPNLAAGCGVDNIQFSSTLLVPEPSTVALFGLGCIGFLIRKSRLQK
jgi:hypothetical protein